SPDLSKEEREALRVYYNQLIQLYQKQSAQAKGISPPSLPPSEQQKKEREGVLSWIKKWIFGGDK
ncbi:MAG: hypothetical protein ACK4S8_14595, partial [Alishewanella aestuarii]